MCACVKKRIQKIEDTVHNIITKIGEKKFYHIFIVFFLLCSIIQIFIPGIPFGHDMSFHLSRIEGITDGLKNGIFPVLIYPGYLSGYGYANGIFYPDIFLYIPAFLHLLGLSTITSCKILLLFITIGIWFSMYFTVKKITKSEYAATMISVLYLMSSYRITDMWVRLALGETITFVFLPLVVLGLYELLYNDPKEWKYLTIGLVGVVLSHLLSGLLCIIVVAVFGLCNLKKLWKEKDRVKYSLIAGFLSLGITAFFTGPLIEVMTSDTFLYQTYFDGNLMVERSVHPLVTILEIPSRMLPWVPQGIGIVFIYLFYRFIRVKIVDDNQRKFKNICIISGVVFLFTSTSLFPWKIFGKILGMLQFPWRFYILVTVLLLLGFAILLKEKITSSRSRTHTMIVLSMFSMFTFMVGTYYTLRADLFHGEKKYGITWGEYVPVDVDITQYEQRGEIITSNHDIEVNFEKKGTTMEVHYQNNESTDTYLELPLLYYKGYEVASDDNENFLITKGNNGMVRVYLTKQEGSFHIYYGITIVRKISIGISIICLSIFMVLFWKSLKKKN